MPKAYLFGIMMIVATALAISIQDLIFKLFSQDLGLWQIFTLRGMIALPVLIGISLIKWPLKTLISSALGRWSLIRGFCITMTLLAFYAAIPFLNLSTVGAANYVAPIFVALLSAYVLKEALGLVRWMGVILGFAGVLVLLQPGGDSFSAIALLPVMGAAFYAVAHLITRSKCQAVPAAHMSLSLNLSMFLAGAFISLVLFAVEVPGNLAQTQSYIFSAWSWVSPRDWLILLILAGFSISTGMMMAAAYKAAPPAIVATFEYSYLIFVAMWDIFFFDLGLTYLALTGILMIVGAGLLVMKPAKS